MGAIGWMYMKACGGSNAFSRPWNRFLVTKRQQGHGQRSKGENLKANALVRTTTSWLERRVMQRWFMKGE